MSPLILAIIFSAGVGALVYSQIGKRIGYSNTQRVWTLVGGSFVLAFIILMITFTYVVHIK